MHPVCRLVPAMRMARVSTTKLLPPADVCQIALKSQSSRSSSSTAPNVGRPARLKLPAQTGLGWAGLAGLGCLGWAAWAGQHSAGSLNGNVSNSAAGWPPSALHWAPATSPGCRVNAELLQLNKYTKPRMIAPCEISMQTAHSARIIFSDSTGLLQLYLM